MARTILLAEGEVVTREMRAACIVREPADGNGVLRKYKRGGPPEAALRQTLQQMALGRRGSRAQRAAGAALLAVEDHRDAQCAPNRAAEAGEVDAETRARAEALLLRAGVPLARQLDVERGEVPIVPPPPRPHRRPAPAEDPPAYRCPDTLELPGLDTPDGGDAT